MKTFLKRLFIALAFVVVLTFAVVNRQTVTVIFDPFGDASSGLSLRAPLFLVFIVAAMIGAVLGGLTVWFGQGRYRRALRAARAEAAKLRAEADRRPPAHPADPLLERRTAA